MLFIFFFGLMVVMYLVQTELANIFSLGEIPLVLYILIPTSILLFNALAYGSIIWFILFILSCVLCFALTMWLLASFHSKINKRLNNKKVAYKKGKLNFKQKSVMQSLLHIEIKNYFNNNIYVFNTLFGMIMLVIASVAGTILYFSNPTIIAGLTGEIIYIIVLLAYCFMCGLSITSNSSISLEGKALYVKKSLPLKTSQIFISKILLNIVVVLPFLIIGFLCILPALIALQLHLIAILSIFLVPLIMLCSLSTVSLMVNLWFPKLNYTTETEVVKQSLSVMITIFLGMVLVGVFALVYAYLLSMLNIYIYVALCTFVLLLIGITFAFLLKTKGQNIFRELN
jgi:ABC-2 type transport system permease protein